MLALQGQAQGGLAARLDKYADRAAGLLADLTASSTLVAPDGSEVVRTAAMPKTAVTHSQVRRLCEGTCLAD